MTAAWMPKEMMSEDSEVLVAVCRLAARVLFEPMPKTTEGVAAMMKVLKPKLCQLFGSQSSSGLLLLWDEQFQLAAMAGVVVEKLPGEDLVQEEVPATWSLILLSMAKASAQCWCAAARIGRQPVVTKRCGSSITVTRRACTTGIPRWAIKP